MSRLVDVAYQEKSCSLSFQDSYGIAKNKTAAEVNAWTGGWSVTNTKRLMYANGQYDPWKDSTVSSEIRPGGPLKSTAELPINLIPGGIHCSDLYGFNWNVNPEVKEIAQREAAQIAAWVDEFYQEKGKTRPT